MKSICAVKGVSASGIKEGKFGLALIRQAGPRPASSRRTRCGRPRSR